MKEADAKKERETGRRKEVRLWNTLRWRLTLFVFGIMMLSGVLTLFLNILLRLLFQGAPLIVALTLNPYVYLMTMLGSCALIGTVLAGKLSLYYLRPLKRLMRATREVKQGNFKVKVDSQNDPDSEMGQLIASFNEMVRELDGIELFRNDFINNFSHEFKTPIVSIRGFARELQRQDLTPEQRREYARIIAEEADRLVQLSTNVLELSKLENQQLVTQNDAFYLDEQLRQCILLMEPQWSEKALEMIPELEEVKICSNEEMLSHVWKNLLSNAIKFTPNGGEIHVTLTAETDVVHVTVRDTGIGMSEEVRDHIFEKFYQGDPSHHRAGYGIGLAMAARALSLCGGSIAVESELGKGSTFTVTLPLRQVIEAEVVE
ncbi:MAG: HAMP domain-containing histidine kinase [Clostridia bacterium]|nr:HAMP domain-containing histidine kinase [Clostridia bacterium]